VGGVADYLREIPCQHPLTGTPGLRHVDAFEVPLPPRQGGRIKFRRDRARWNRWRLALVEAGLIEVPEPEELVHQIRAAETYAAECAADGNMPEDRRKVVASLAEERVSYLKGARIPGVRQVPALSSVEALVEAIGRGDHDARLSDLLLVEERPEVIDAIKGRAKARRGAK
jgi:hypothetical protein